MTDAYKAGYQDGIRKAVALVEAMQERRQVVWPKDILALLDAPAPAGVRVKPLEWYQLGIEKKASTAFGPYIVASYDLGEWGCWTPNESIEDEPGHGFHNSEAEAIEYANQHFCKSIMAALEPAPAGVTVQVKGICNDAVSLCDQGHPISAKNLALQILRALSENRT